MRRLTRALLVPALALATIAWSGCKGKGGGDEGYQCIRDAELLEETQDCFEDDDCPCGSHCGLGLCRFECASDEDCDDGLQCDSFGRCTVDGELGAAIDVEPHGRVQVSPSRIQLSSDGAVRRLTLTVKGHDSGPVRIAAGPGVELRCGSGDEFLPECELTNLSPSGEPIALSVRSTGEMPSSVEAQSDINIFAAEQRIALSVRHLPKGEVPVSPRPIGVYKGFVWPVVAGSKSRSHTDDLPAEMTDIRLPVELQVFAADGDTHPVRLVDSFGLLFPEREVGAQLAYGEDGRWRLELPAWHVVGPSNPGESDVEVWVPAIQADALWSGEHVTATIETVFAGATTEEYAPYLQWQLSASWARDLSPDANAPGLDADYEPLQDAERGSSSLAIEPLVRTALSDDLVELTVGGTSSAWTQATMCTAVGEGSASFLAPSILQVDGADSPAGDLACGEAGGSYPPPTFDLMTSNLLTVNENISTCLNDLAQVRLAVDEGDPDAPLASDGCIGAGRVITALGYATEKDRARVFGEAPLPDFEASALGMRLVQQWLDMHAFVAREADQVQQLNDILDPESSEDGPVGQSFTVSEAMSAAIEGWDLLLHPRFGVPLSAIPTKVLLSPDYRDRLFPDEEYADRQSYTQSVGVPASMLDALAIELRVMESLVDQAQRGLADPDEIEELLGRLFRRTAVVMSTAHALHTAAAATAEPEWEGHWQSSRQGAASATRELMRAVERLRSGTNPLGIEDVDLPLYRIGDQGTATQRFSALSDYLLGTTDDGIAQYMTQRAAGELGSAREAWFANVERDVGAQLEGFERERRIEAIGAQFGGVITSLCGNPEWDSATVLEIWDQVDANTCYVDPECKPTADDVREQVTTASIGNTLCMASRLRQRFGPTITSGDPAFDQLLDDMANMFAVARSAFPFRVSNVAETDDDVVVTLQELTGSFVAPISINALSSMRMGLPEQAPADFIEIVTVECETMRQGSDDARPAADPMSCTFADDCPVDAVCTSGACAPDPGEALSDRPDCYRGALGSQALAVRSAGREVTKARSELSQFSERYDIAMRSCFITQVGNRAIEQATTNHNTLMAILGGVKLAADIVSSAAETAMSAAGAATAPWSGAVATAAGAYKVIADTTSLSLEFAMTTATAQHQQNLLEIENDVEELKCFNDAAMELVGVRTAAVRVQQASIDLARQMVEFNNLKNQVAGAAVEGHQALEAEIGRRATPITTDFWLSEDVDRYRRFLRQARRAVYLSVLAVEYEFQFTSMARMDVLAARTPAQLQDVIDEMRAYTLTGTVGGGSPSNRLTVVSLRDHLIQMADRSDFPDGWHQLSAAERLRVLLSAPAYSIYDEAGAYLGQEIPFTISPMGSLELGDSQGIPLLAGTDCAERLWSVNASLLGDDLYTGSDTTFATVVLRKRNTFFSQWCTEGELDPFQVASTRPSRNLFLDPLDFEGSNTMLTPQPDATVTDEVNAYTNARISAYFNVSQAELENEGYFNGDSQELAGRGLFGDFALFFPAETLALEGGDGLRLRHIDDILLRLDYVSVARSG